MKKLTFLFALLCVSVVGWGDVVTEASCTTDAEGYSYTFSNDTEGAVTLVVTVDNALPGVSNPLVYNSSNQSTAAASVVENRIFTFNLGTFAQGATLTYRTYFPYEAGGLFQKDNLTYTVGSSCGGGGSTPTGLCGTDEYANNVGDDYKIRLTSTIIDGRYIVCVESAKDGKSIDRVFTDNIWCHTSNGNLQLGIPANHKVVDGKLYFIIPSSTVPDIYTGDGVYVYFSDNTARAFPASTYNLPLTACSEEVSYGVDFVCPSITAASLVSKTSAQAVISITATDNIGVTECAVYDGTAHLGDYALVDGKITVTELMYNHAYTLTIKAKDAMGNVSDNSVNVAVTTDDNTEIVDTSTGTNLGNMALSSAGSSATATTGNAGAALDDLTTGGSRWESAASDPQVWTLDLGQERVFNNIQICWEGAYGKTFTLAISNDNANWTTVHYVKGQSLAGFPYEQSIDLPQLKARYIRFRGIERGTGYGYSFWEFRVFFIGEPSVLTTMTASIDKRYCQISTGTANISLSCKDQYNQDIDPGVVTYNISPDASYGTVTAGVFTPTKPGLITITAQSGLVVSNTVEIWGTSSTNLAFNHLHSASTGETVLDERPASYAVDNSENTEWQSHAGTADTDEARTYDAWLIVDLGDKFDIELVAVKFEGASSQTYRIEFTDDLANEWKSGATYSGSAGTNARRDEHSSLENNAGVQYVRFFSTKAATQYGMKIQEIRVFGTISATPTKSISASVNNALYGTATVNGESAVEVATGSTVTFSAVANSGYIFVDWSNGETRATFETTADANMHLTANFRVAGTTYCNTEVTSTRDDDVHTAYVTLKRTSANNYKLVVRSAETLGNFTNTELVINGGTVQNLNNQGTLTDENHVLTYEFTSTTAPYMNTPYLYLNVSGSKHGECWFTKLTNIEYDVPCDDAVVPTEISLSQTSANLLLGNTLTLTPSFTPVYASDRAITWETSNSSIATVDNGVVSPVAEGTAVITAILTSDNSISAACNVTVVGSLPPATWYFNGFLTPAEGLTGYTCAITRNADMTLTFTMTTDKNVIGYVSSIVGDVQGEFGGYTAETHQGTFTTAAHYNENDPLSCRLTFASANYGAPERSFTYRVGSENAPIKAVAFDDSKDNATLISDFEDDEVVTIVTRTFPRADEWYTLCLPFDMTHAQLEAVFGEGYTLAEMTGAEDRGSLIHLNFDYVHALEAGKAYMFKPGETITSNPTFEGVTIKNVNPSTLKSANSIMEFEGTFNTMTLTSEYQRFVGPENYLYSPAVGGTPMNAFRCFFTIPENSPARNAAKPARVVVGSQVVTELDAVQGTELQATKVVENGVLYIICDGHKYNAQGMLVK